jgi:hypothetical protein
MLSINIEAFADEQIGDRLNTGEIFADLVLTPVEMLAQWFQNSTGDMVLQQTHLKDAVTDHAHNTIVKLGSDIVSLNINVLCTMVDLSECSCTR